MVATKVRETNGRVAPGAAGSPSRSTVLLDGSRVWLETVGGIVCSLGMEVAGAATTPAAALRLIEEHRPDLLVSEIGLEGETDGIVLMQAARARAPGLAVLALASSSDTEHIEEALAAGAQAYLVKTDHPDDLASAMELAFERSINGNTRPKEPAGAAEDPAES